MPSNKPKKSKYEKDLLRDLREARRNRVANGKECSNINCAELGQTQPLDYFYDKKSGGKDSYCIVCRKGMSQVRREHKQFLPQDGKPVQMKKWVPKKWTPNLGKAPWCKDHRTNSKNCGCATGIFFIKKEHRAKIAKALKGNKNAKGPHKKIGPMSLEHRAKIAMKVRETLRMKREKAEND